MRSHLTPQSSGHVKLVIGKMWVAAPQANPSDHTKLTEGSGMGLASAATPAPTPLDRMELTRNVSRVPCHDPRSHETEKSVRDG